VDFDAGQIHQVIMNLGTNSAHALGGRGGRIHFSLGRVKPDRARRDRHPQVTAAHTVCLAVRDNGCGMRPDVLERIFEPFFTTKPFGEGTGLGLAIVHSIMTGHNGAVVVESTEGVGTAFYLYFPGATVALAAPGCDGDPVGALPAPFGGGRLALLVDDDAQVLAVMGGLVGRMGFAVESHTRPEEAIEAFRRDPGRFSIAITDLTMPRISGIELAREVMAIRPGFPIVLSSGHVPERSGDQALAMGIRCVIRKPFDAGFLAEQLRTLI
jgi:CheY-like chemotaxis protein